MLDFRETIRGDSVNIERVKLEFPSDGLRFPKAHELPPFQPFEEVAGQTGNLDADSPEAHELWATVFLNRDEIEEQTADSPWRIKSNLPDSSPPTQACSSRANKSSSS